MSNLNQLQLTVIWIRHAEKAYANNRGPNGSFQHDPPIIESEEKRIREHAEHLAKRYGPPQIAISSPYLRARQTLSTMLSVFKEEQRPQPQVDAQIAEFLGFRSPRILDGAESYQPDVSPETAAYAPPPIQEGTDSLLKRVENHLSMLTLHQDLPRHPVHSAVIWIVTHGIVIARIFDHLHNQLKAKMIHAYEYQAPWSNKSPHPLEGITVMRKYKSLTMSILRVPKPKKEVAHFDLLRPPAQVIRCTDASSVGLGAEGQSSAAPDGAASKPVLPRCNSSSVDLSRIGSSGSMASLSELSDSSPSPTPSFNVPIIEASGSPPIVLIEGMPSSIASLSADSRKTEVVS